MQFHNVITRSAFNLCDTGFKLLIFLLIQVATLMTIIPINTL
jgi:hypothetical protein